MMYDTFVRAVIVKNNKMFLLNEVKNGQERWAFPGGKVEPNENIIQALRRELYEELSVHCLEQKKIFSQDFTIGDQIWHGHFFLCTVDSFNFSFEPCVKGSNFFEYDEILELKSDMSKSDMSKEDFREILDKVNNFLKLQH